MHAQALADMAVSKVAYRARTQNTSLRALRLSTTLTQHADVVEKLYDKFQELKKRAIERPDQIKDAVDGLVLSWA